MTERFVFGLLAGAAWNAASLWCLSRLLGAWIGPQPSRRRALAWLPVKLSLYAAAWWLLSRPAVSLIGFSLGFTLVLALAAGGFILRARGVALARADGR